MNEKDTFRTTNALSLKLRRVKQSVLYLCKMDPTVRFHPGVVIRLTKEQKRKRDLQRKKDKEREHRRNQSRQPFVPRPVWRILPCDFEMSFFIDTLHGNSFFEKMNSIEDFGSLYQKKSALFPDYRPNPELIQSIQRLKREAKAKLAENQILRWKFKRFLSKWRLRHFKVINETDCITLSPIGNPVRVYHFPTRSLYTFESSSILQDIHKKLLHHCGQIPNPLYPRNPFTNEQFTLAQLLSIHQQCRSFGHSSWIFEAFHKSKLSIPTLLMIQRKALRLHAFKTILYDVSDYEGVALLLNFIESQHEEHNAIFNKALYRWCLVKLPEEPKIQMWRAFCKQYYEEDILAEDDTERDECFIRISRKTGHLCAPPHDLLAKRNLLAHKK